MNRIILILGLLCSFHGLAQKRPETLQAKKVTSPSKPLPAPVNAIAPVAFTTVEQCDQMINAIDRRIAAVRSDEKKNAAALANGWYNRMAADRQRYVDRKNKLRQTSK